MCMGWKKSGCTGKLKFAIQKKSGLASVAGATLWLQDPARRRRDSLQRRALIHEAYEGPKATCYHRYVDSNLLIASESA